MVVIDGMMMVIDGKKMIDGMLTKSVFHMTRVLI